MSLTQQEPLYAGMTDQDLKVSVIVPVCQADAQLPLCLDSLLFQTLPEIEIIVVHAPSAGLAESLRKYASLSPEKLRCVAAECDCPAAAREEGLRHARAPYVLFVEPTSCLGYHACEWLYQTAAGQDADVVYGHGFQFFGATGDCQPLGSLKECSRESLIATGELALHGLLLRKTFALEINLAQLMASEEEAIGILSRTEKVAIFNRSACFACNAAYPPAAPVNSIRLNNLLWEHCDPAYQPQLAARLLARIAAEAQTNCAIYDQYVAHAKDFANRILAHGKALRTFCTSSQRKQFVQLLLEPDEKLPTTVYLNGFDQTISREAYLRHVGTAFAGGQEICWLDEESINMASAPERIRALWAAGDAETVGAWAAATMIAEHGGVYIGTDIRVTGTFNRMLFQKAFFGFRSNREFNTGVFGGQAGHDVWQVLAGMLANPAAEGCQQSFGLALCGWGGIHLNGTAQTNAAGVSVFASDVFTCRVDLHTHQNICQCIPRADSPEALAAEISRWYNDAISNLAAAHKEEVAILSNDSPRVTMLSEKIQTLREEIRTMKDSASWRTTRPLRGLENKINEIKQKFIK